MNIDLIRVDYLNKKHAEDIGYLMDAYAIDSMGGAMPLT